MYNMHFSKLHKKLYFRCAYYAYPNFYKLRVPIFGCPWNFNKRKFLLMLNEASLFCESSVLSFLLSVKPTSGI